MNGVKLMNLHSGPSERELRGNTEGCLCSHNDVRESNDSVDLAGESQ